MLTSEWRQDYHNKDADGMIITARMLTAWMLTIEWLQDYLNEEADNDHDDDDDRWWWWLQQ